MSVSLVEVMVAASRRLAPLSGECAGHAVLAAADQLLSNPRLVGAAQVLIEDNGTVRLAGAPASDERGCDQGLRGLLDGLLAVAHSGGAGLFRVGQRTATGDLGQLVKELEVALIPANRAAARRSLARLHRETERARDAGRLEGASDALPGHVVPHEPAPPSLSRVEVEEPPARAMSADSARVPREAHASPHGSDAELSASELDLLAITEVRFATGPRVVSAHGAQVPQPTPPSVETDFGIDVDVDVDMIAATPEVPMQHTQPLPKVAPRRELHETMPLPPVSTGPKLRSEHETPLEPVLGRRHAGVPTAPYEPADIHKTPYLGTLVAPAPDYDPPPRERGQGETWPMPKAVATAEDASAPTNWDEDDATTDPAPVVAWSVCDDAAEDGVTELAEAADVSDGVTELAKAEDVSDGVTELAEAEDVSDGVTELAKAEDVSDGVTELAKAADVSDGVTELAEAADVSDGVTELAKAEDVSDGVAEFAEDPVAEFAENDFMELAEDPVAEFAEDPVAEFAEDSVAEFAEDDFMELAEDEITEIGEDDITELGEDDVVELMQASPLAACAALAVQPWVSTLPDPKPPRVPRTSDVEALLERFRVAEPEPDPLLMRGLKQLAGITLTPPPVLALPEGARATPESATRSEPGAPIRPVPTVRVVGS